MSSPFSSDYAPKVTAKELIGRRPKSIAQIMCVKKFGVTPPAQPVKNIHASIATPDPFKGAKIRRGGL